MEILGTLTLATFVWLVLCAATSIATSLVWWVIGRRVSRAHPLDRGRAALVIGTLPIVLPSAVVLACLVPGLLELLGGPPDHCAVHAHDVHLCLAHPRVAFSPGLAVLVFFGVLGIAHRLRPAIAAWWAVSLNARRLRRAPAESLASDVRQLALDRPFCFTSGFLRPSVWVSKGLWQRLSEEQRATVLAHERAHVRRRDPLQRAAASIGAALLGPNTRREVLTELHLASERVCDEAAARAVRDRLRVAESLLAVERICGGAPAEADAAVYAAFGGSGLRERIHGLLEPEAEISPHRLGWRIAAMAVAVAFAFDVLPLHHVVEHALELLPPPS